jgi:hypothetical protein
MEHLALDHGITSFKIFMLYGGYGLVREIVAPLAFRRVAVNVREPRPAYVSTVSQ